MVGSTELASDPSVTLFTFAELEYALAGSDTWPTTRARIGLPVPESADEIRAAGLASLIARGLATSDGEKVRLPDLFIGTIAAVDAASTWVEVGYLSNGQPMGAYYGQTNDDVAVLMSIAGPGVFELRALGSTGGADSPFAEVVAGLLDEGGELIVGTRSPDGGRDAVVLKPASSGTWEQSDPLSSAPATVVARDAAIESATSVLRRAAA
jgi:hypothetical protein